jgi:hypothetical protein
MDDTAIVGENIEVVQAGSPGTRSALSWSAAIAGALAAFAVSFIVIALGAGIGLAVASPYASGLSATTLTVAGAIWLVLAQSFGFATGGYIAGRLRTPPLVAPLAGEGNLDENRFRDGAHGFVAWAIGVVAITIMVFAATGATVATTPRAGAMMASAAVEGPATVGTGGAATSQGDPLAYYVDALLRANPPREATATVPRDQMTRIMARAVFQTRLSDDDRAYLAAIVASQTGLSTEEASRRVDDVVNQARESTRQVAEATRQAGSYLSFWMFMSLLFGAVAGTLGGMLGGELRDNAMRASLVPA